MLWLYCKFTTYGSDIEEGIFNLLKSKCLFLVRRQDSNGGGRREEAGT